MDITLRRLSDLADPDSALTSPPEGERVREPLARRARRAVIGALAVIGTLVVAWVAVSSLLGLSVVVSQSGSAASSVPAGAAAVVHRVPADQLNVGDVVTKTAPDGPVLSSHQVVAIGEVPGDPSSRSLTLRNEGTAGGRVDRYRVSEMDVVIAAAPHLGRALSWMDRPVLTMCLGAVAAGIVIWVIRPVRGRRECASSGSGSRTA